MIDEIDFDPVYCKHVVLYATVNKLVRALNTMESAKPAPDNRYATALSLMNDFINDTTMKNRDLFSFEQWLIKRLNADEPHCA